MYIYKSYISLPHLSESWCFFGIIYSILPLSFFKTFPFHQQGPPLKPRTQSVWNTWGWLSPICMQQVTSTTSTRGWLVNGEFQPWILTGIYIYMYILYIWKNVMEQKSQGFYQVWLIVFYVSVSCRKARCLSSICILQIQRDKHKVHEKQEAATKKRKHGTKHSKHLSKVKFCNLLLYTNRSLQRLFPATFHCRKVPSTTWCESSRTAKPREF